MMGQKTRAAPTHLPHSASLANCIALTSFSSGVQGEYPATARSALSAGVYSILGPLLVRGGCALHTGEAVAFSGNN